LGSEEKKGKVFLNQTGLIDILPRRRQSASAIDLFCECFAVLLYLRDGEAFALASRCIVLVVMRNAKPCQILDVVVRRVVIEMGDLALLYGVIMM
jgi:hypothetical protein